MKEDCERILHELGNAWCESCGAAPEQHVSIFDGGTDWCLECARMDEMITEDEYQECELDSLKLREQYLVKSLAGVRVNLVRAGVV